MKKTIIALSIALPTSVFAGGFERNPQTPNFLFNDGRYAEFNFTVGDPDVEGSVPLGTASQGSKNVASNYNNVGFAYKAQINEKMDWAIAYVEPYGADINYRSSDPLYPYRTSWAKLDVKGLTALLKYKFSDRVSVYGGAKLSEFDADANVVITIPNPASGAPLNVLDYKVNAEEDRATGYVIGAAYEMKEIAMRVALTYNTEIEHESSVVESATGVSLTTGPFVIADQARTVDTTLPASLNLSFQTGLNQKTLLFGSVHWAEWTSSEMVPTLYSQVTATAANPAGSKLVSHDDDTTTLKLGLGRRINEKLSLAVILGHEKSTGKRSSNLAPTDGFDSLTFAGTLTEGKSKITAGVSFIEVGDTDTNAIVGQSDFTSNKAVGFGVTYGYHF